MARSFRFFPPRLGRGLPKPRHFRHPVKVFDQEIGVDKRLRKHDILRRTPLAKAPAALLLTHDKSVFAVRFHIGDPTLHMREIGADKLFFPRMPP